MKNNTSIKRMEIYMAKLISQGGSVQCGERPVLIVQNNIGNANSPTVIVVPLTSKAKKDMPTHVEIPIKNGLTVESVALCEQIITLPTNRLEKKMGMIRDKGLTKKINEALKVSLGLI